MATAPHKVLLLALTLALPARVGAVVGGRSFGPEADSPAARVDPNSVDSPFAGVGSLLVAGGSSFSAAAIAPEFVLTAAHVVAGRDPATLSFALNAGGPLSHSFSAAEVWIHPSYTGSASADRLVHDDLAIIRLAAPLPDTIPTYRLAPEVAVGQTLTLVGYGAGGDGIAGVTVGRNPTVKRRGENVADLLFIDDDGGAAQEIYAFDFDAPRIGNITSGPSLGNQREATLAGGDSGSPAFVQVAGEWQLAGINTFVTAYGGGPPPPRFFSFGGGVVLDGYSAWIDGIVSPIPEPGNGLLWWLGLPLVALAVRRHRR